LILVVIRSSIDVSDFFCGIGTTMLCKADRSYRFTVVYGAILTVVILKCVKPVVCNTGE
jgi:hypothetical protein